MTGWLASIWLRRGTYRSVLHRLAGPMHGGPGQRATPFAGATPPPPYSEAERGELAAIATAQRDPAKRASAMATVVSGAGLRPGELVALRGSAVARHGRQVVVQVGGHAPRVVPVTSRHAGRAAELARGAGTGYLFRPGPADRGYKNFVTNFARALAADPAAPLLTMSRGGRRPGAPPDRAARPGHWPESGGTVGRAAGPARADPGHRQAARAADPGRAGRQPGPAGPAGVPAGPDGGHRRAGPVGGAVLPPIADLERACDYLIVLVGSRVQIAGPAEELLATHHLLSGPRRDPATLPAGQQVISASHTDRQTTLLVRTSDPVLDPAWTVSEVGLEDLVLAYMRQARPGRRNHHLEVQK